MFSLTQPFSGAQRAKHGIRIWMAYARTYRGAGGETREVLADECKLMLGLPDIPYTAWFKVSSLLSVHARI